MKRRVAMTLAFSLTACASSEAQRIASQPAEHEHAPDHADHYQHAFDDPERWAAVFDDPERDVWQKPEEVVRKLDLKPGAVVADVGAGTGYFAPHLSRAVGDAGSVLAVDIEPSMITYLRDRFEKEGLANSRAILGRPNDPQLEPYSVDRILVVNTWHHIPSRPTYAQLLYDALKAGGRLAIVDFTEDSPMGPPRQHRVPPEQVASTLRSAGFEAVVADETLPRQYIVLAQKPGA